MVIAELEPPPSKSDLPPFYTWATFHLLEHEVPPSKVIYRLFTHGTTFHLLEHEVRKFEVESSFIFIIFTLDLYMLKYL